MTTIADRLREARLRARYTSASNAARAFGWPVSTYLGHENGDRAPSLDTIKQYAKAFRANASYIAYGEEQLAILPKTESFVKLYGFVGDGGAITKEDFNLSAGDLLKIEMVLPSDTFALMVISSNISPRFQISDTLLIKSGFTSDAGMLDEHVYVKTADGREYIRTVRRGGGVRKYDLLPQNEDDTTIKSVDIDQFGVIVMIVPGGFYTDLGVKPLVTRITSLPDAP